MRLVTVIGLAAVPDISPPGIIRRLKAPLTQGTFTLGLLLQDGYCPGALVWVLVGASDREALSRGDIPVPPLCASDIIILLSADGVGFFWEEHGRVQEINERTKTWQMNTSWQEKSFDFSSNASVHLTLNTLPCVWATCATCIC